MLKCCGLGNVKQHLRYLMRLKFCFTVFFQDGLNFYDLLSFGFRKFPLVPCMHAYVIRIESFFLYVNLLPIRNF